DVLLSSRDHGAFIVLFERFTIFIAHLFKFLKILLIKQLFWQGQHPCASYTKTKLSILDLHTNRRPIRSLRCLPTTQIIRLELSVLTLSEEFVHSRSPRGRVRKGNILDRLKLDPLIFKKVF